MTTSRYTALLDERAGKLNAMDSVLALAASEEKTTQFEALEKDIKAIDAEIAIHEKRKALEIFEPTPSRSAFRDMRDLGADKPYGFSIFGMTESEFVRQSPNAGLPETNPQHPRRVYQEAAFGEFLQDVYRANTNQGIDPRLTYVSAAQGAGAAVGPDGGFLVHKTMQDSIKMRMAGGQILSRVNPIPLDDGTDGIELNVIDETSRITGSRHGGVRGYWVDEGTAATATKPKFRKYSLKVKGLAALGYATNNLLRNARALGSIMTDAFGDELRFLTEDAIINGQGAGQPSGIALSTGPRISQTKETGQVAATVVYENISNMWSRLLPDLRANAVWLIHSDVEPQLDKLSIAVGTGGLEPRFVTYGADGVMRIKGKPVVPVEYCATLGTVNDIILTNFDDYGFIEVPIEQASSMHVAFITNEMCFRVMYYVDGAPYLRSAITPFKGNTTQSSAVVLATRS